jgi:hypothetical protein
MKSPDGTFEVVCSNYREIRMGSPEFGSIEIIGSQFRPEGRSFGDAMAFSPDSRFLAISELVDASQPASRVVLFDLKKKKERIVFSRYPSLILKVDWPSPDEVRIHSWSLPGGDEHSSWRVEPDDIVSAAKPWWKFWA